MIIFEITKKRLEKLDPLDMGGARSGRLWNAKRASLEREAAEFKVQRCRVEGAKVPSSGCKGAELNNCGGRYT